MAVRLLEDLKRLLFLSSSPLRITRLNGPVPNKVKRRKAHGHGQE